jgi:GNAT superfamily N-acetyltransferase
VTRVKSDRELVAAADENFIASFRTLTDHVPDGECRDAPGLFAFATGLPVALFNGCVVTAPVEAEDLDSAVAWVKDRDARFRVWVSEELGAARAHLGRAPGLAAEAAPYPGMTLHPVPDPPVPAAGVTVVPVGADGFDEFVGVLVDAGLERDLALRLFPSGFVADPTVALFVGRLDGEVVGTSLAIRSDTACGVYNVVTLERARRRGVGTALTWAAVAAGRAWGHDTIVLQSSAMAVSMYRAMGFRLVAPYAVFSSTTPR